MTIFKPELVDRVWRKVNFFTIFLRYGVYCRYLIIFWMDTYDPTYTNKKLIKELNKDKQTLVKSLFFTLTL